MKHVFGMAKRHLDLKGAKAQKLELDFLRLVYVVKELRRVGKDAQGYLLVMKAPIQQRVARWQEKYQAGDTVRVCVARLSPDQCEALDQEIARNKAGMVAGTLGKKVGGHSDATFGSQLGEDELRKWIEREEPGVQKCDTKDAPFGIQWDYYGQR